MNPDRLILHSHSSSSAHEGGSNLSSKVVNLSLWAVLSDDCCATLACLLFKTVQNCVSFFFFFFFLESTKAHNALLSTSFMVSNCLCNLKPETNGVCYRSCLWSNQVNALLCSICHHHQTMLKLFKRKRPVQLSYPDLQNEKLWTFNWLYQHKNNNNFIYIAPDS